MLSWFITSIPYLNITNSNLREEYKKYTPQYASACQGLWKEIVCLPVSRKKKKGVLIYL